MQNLLETGLHRLQELFGYNIFRFKNRQEWATWRASNPQCFSSEYIEAKAQSILSRGAYSAWLGFAPPEKIVQNSKNLRESFNANGFNPRQRAVLDLVASCYLPENKELSIFAPELVTKFARELSTRFPNFVGSEFIPDQEIRNQKRLRHEDLAHLTFEDEVFDLVIANEVFEHLPKLQRSLCEIFRVLKQGGSLVATFPFATNVEKNIIKAYQRENGEIEYLTKPEYHGNPIDPEKGSLVFQLPAWEIIEMAKDCGFNICEMNLFQSTDAAILSSDMDGVLIFIAQKGRALPSSGH